jgi:hypothetical protein
MEEFDVQTANTIANCFGFFCLSEQVVSCELRRLRPETPPLLKNDFASW